ncbi:hypothetical protein ASPZODRAFT_129428 [Penicilliopsis zonata CBS 506.65]|uniref:Formin GTPase-binding domain-containing protein n=1 Tax=Penicilliopsis zonata CBS 506.65 TaxID=1073090 RepID=A0A1L9SP52_9EURO|nr:hypothetical protein ASPZODRAFT_129428 [Penicilliopsis zonata CBS 506.65]OJJ49049.1 hypothetical protein ASPZODRAFT_129428 [Penicilliopsis zonata CBS 506.65]
MAPTGQAPNIFDDATRSPAKTSVFRSFISSRAHKRNSSADDALPSPIPLQQERRTETMPSHGSQGQVPLGEREPNRDAAESISSGQKSPSKSMKGLHKKTKSAVSLKSLRSYMERKEPKTSDAVEDDDWRPKKAKSSNSLSAILKRSQRDRKADSAKDMRDKENRSPVDLCENMPPTPSIPSPTWGNYPEPSLQVPPSRGLVQDKRRSVNEEMELYTPKGYNPSVQRNFYDYNQPSLTKRLGSKPRPKSDCLTGNRKVQEMVGPFQQRSPSDKGPYTDTTPNVPSRMVDGVRKLSAAESCSDSDKKQDPAAMHNAVKKQDACKKQDAGKKKSSRVQAAISAFNAKDQEPTGPKATGAPDIESEFEKLLDARNIPQNMRDKMRSLDTHIKADFIQKDRAENGTPQSAGPGSNDSTGRRGRRKDQKEEQESKGSQSRSRSRGFTFSSKGSSSPSKKQRPENGTFYRRPKSVDLSQPSGGFKIATPTASVTSLALTACHDTAADPSDFVHYLREIQKPEMVEVGKIHKLRLLLRNETVSWVDTFIADGGMDEIVQLLYRIMKVEWREEHEDNLLHETLLCLKGLCTTSVALKRLTTIESELFPALLKMLFDEEKKGPSEFTTRTIIMNLLFTQLSMAPTSAIAAERAIRILSYLRDPAPSEENQPPAFIANIYQCRPYRVWCKEVTNVTKEVFWIFLHHLNVIPIVKDEGRSAERTSYQQRHFPAIRPPVPAAPYVGGVEWDATNYLASHLDLMNGLLASLPGMNERNQLRTELRASGFEKVMGGSLRTCKEKFYSAIHDCLRTWIAAAIEDGWPYTMVREGPPRPGEPGSPTKSPLKAVGVSPKKGLIDERPPKLELALDLPVNNQSSHTEENFGNWL